MGSSVTKTSKTPKSAKKLAKMMTDSPIAPPTSPEAPVAPLEDSEAIVMLPWSEALLAVLEFQEMCEKLFEGPEARAEQARREEMEQEATVVDDEGDVVVLWCPRCDVELEYGEVEKQTDGELFCYWRCPREKNGVKCFVVHAADDFCGEFLEKVRAQLADCYVPSGDSVQDHRRGVIPFIDMECYCCTSLVLLESRSEKNPGQLFFKCRKGECNFFQWGDSVPRNKTWKWLKMRMGPEEKLAQAKPPADLKKPGCKCPAEVTPRTTSQSKKSKESGTTQA